MAALRSLAFAARRIGLFWVGRQPAERRWSSVSLSIAAADREDLDYCPCGARPRLI